MAPAAARGSGLAVTETRTVGKRWWTDFRRFAFVDGEYRLLPRGIIISLRDDDFINLVFG